MKFKNYYDTLGISRNATQDQVRSAYRKLARRHHPDCAKEADKALAEEKIKEINEAYEVLKDPVKREKYDRLGEHWDQEAFASGSHHGFGGGSPFGGFSTSGHSHHSNGHHRKFHFQGTGFSDFFEQFFGADIGPEPFGASPGTGRTRYHYRSRPASRDGDDLESNLMVTLEEAHRGATRTIALRGTDPASGQETTTTSARLPEVTWKDNPLRTSAQNCLFLEALFSFVK